MCHIPNFNNVLCFYMFICCGVIKNVFFISSLFVECVCNTKYNLVGKYTSSFLLINICFILLGRLFLSRPRLDRIPLSGRKYSTCLKSLEVVVSIGFLKKKSYFNFNMVKIFIVGIAVNYQSKLVDLFVLQSIAL